MSIHIGELRIDRVEEFCAPAIMPEEFLVGMPSDAFSQNADWFLPWGGELATNKLIVSVHSWLVRTQHHIVLIDTCFGNHKNRPQVPPGHQLKSPWLERLAAHGVMFPIC